jgi:hypothetical protein
MKSGLRTHPWLSYTFNIDGVSLYVGVYTYCIAYQVIVKESNPTINSIPRRLHVAANVEFCPSTFTNGACHS